MSDFFQHLISEITHPQQGLAHHHHQLDLAIILLAMLGHLGYYRKQMFAVFRRQPKNEQPHRQAVRYRNSSEANPPSLFELRKGSPRHSSSPQASRYSGEGE